MSEKWYKGVYRRNLVDMHIADWDESFLSSFSVDEYVDCLIEGKIQSPMIYLQSHTGLCNFDSKTGPTHAFFKKNPDTIHRLIDECHSRGMKVVGYYSLIFNNAIADIHPEWEMRFSDGDRWRDKGQRYGLCCPNNEEYRKFLSSQIKELGEQFPNLEGIFYDMPYWEVVCHCPSCEKRYRKETGKAIPSIIDWEDDDWRLFAKKRQEWMGEFASFVEKESIKSMPNTTVEFNYAASVACDWLAGSTELINDHSEFAGGDLYGDMYNHSFACKYYSSVTRNTPFEYMTCRCNKKLREHTITKSQRQIEAEVMLTMAHHGASLVIDAINPDGTLDGRPYKMVGKAFDRMIPYERFMDWGELYSPIGVFFDSRIQYKNGASPTNKECAINSVRTLVENHLPAGVAANGNDFSKYKMIIASSLGHFPSENDDLFIEYVKNGGILYLSGRSSPRLMEEFFGAKYSGDTFGDSKFPKINKGYDEVQAYIRPIGGVYEGIFGDFNEKYPLPVTYRLPIYEFGKGEVKAKITLPYTDPDDNSIFASIHSNPPHKATDIAAAAETTYGKGKVIWMSAPIESDERGNFKDIFIKVIEKEITKTFNLKASKKVELVIFKKEDDYLLNLVDLGYDEEDTDRNFVLVGPEGYDFEDMNGNKLGNKVESSFVGFVSLFARRHG